MVARDHAGVSQRERGGMAVRLCAGLDRRMAAVAWERHLGMQERRWRNLGNQRLTERLLIDSPDDVVVWLGNTG